MAKLVFGDDFVDQNTVCTSLINANSPMVWDATMLGALEVYARNNQATVISPFILAGAMSPVTVAGTCAQLYAEALAGMALTQLVRPGARGLRHLRKLHLHAVRRADLRHPGAAARPVRGGRAGAAPWRALPQRRRPVRLEDPGRAGCLRVGQHLQHAMLAGVNFMLHVAGWLEGGLAMGYEKFVMDADQAAMMERFLNGVDLSENGQALDALREVGPGAHFLGCAHTQANFEIRLLPLHHRGQQQLRAVGERRGDGCRRAGPTSSGKASSQRTRRRHRRRRRRGAAGLHGGQEGSGARLELLAQLLVPFP